MPQKRIVLTTRNATIQDVPSIVDLSVRVYGEEGSYTEDMLNGVLNTFPEGQFVAEYNGDIVGFCATFIIAGKHALKPHTWLEITGNGYGTRHDENGDYLYGMDVFVDSRLRGLRIGQRLYDARKTLCKTLGLKGIVFGGRMPNLSKRIKQVGSAQGYLDQVLIGAIRDPVIGFQLRNKFEVIGTLPKYLPFDAESLGYASHMVWRNPEIDLDNHPSNASQTGQAVNVRIASIQFQARKVASFEEYRDQIEFFIDTAADYRSDFVLFPELFTLPLLSADKRNLTALESIEAISEYTEQFVVEMQRMALSYNINIIGGSHPTRIGDHTYQNICYVFLRDGTVHRQAKIQPTPAEQQWWNMSGGDTLKVIPTDCGPIGILICYDSEFPELARHLTDQGARILFVPYCTDERQGHLRVRYCCQARAVENQLYVVTAGMVGNLPSVANMDVHYAESGIFTPCDFPFARDGIAALADANTEAMIFADLRLDQLTISRNSGTVRNLKDRRFELYRVHWSHPSMGAAQVFSQPAPSDTESQA